MKMFSSRRISAKAAISAARSGVMVRAGQVERHAPYVTKAGWYLLLPRFGDNRTARPIRVATLYEAIDLLNSGRYLLRTRGVLTGTMSTCLPKNVVVVMPGTPEKDVTRLVINQAA